MKIEEKFKIGIREIGLKNELTNYGFLAFFEDLATFHSDMVGYGIKDIPIRNGAWLLMDWDLQVYKRPKFGETITINTCAVSIEKPSFHCYRNFEIFNEAEELIATATSKWIFFNFKLNKITKLLPEALKEFKPERDLLNAENRLLKLKEPASYEKIFDYTVKRMDIDVNMHMNNLNYLKLAYEVLPDEIYSGVEPKNLRIMYKNQIKYGDKVKCFYTQENNKHIVSIKSDDEKKIHAIIQLW